MKPITVRIGHSPDPDDAFMFFGFASGAVTLRGYDISHELHDIQTLNHLAAGVDPFEVTALSASAYLGLEGRYELLEMGTSVGRGYGPRVVSSRPMRTRELQGKRIALPGSLTTAALVSRMLLPPFVEVHMNFTEIVSAVQAGTVDAGVLIHEGQLTYSELGMHLIADLGVLFANRFNGLPLPLGVNCVREDLPPALKRQIRDGYRSSIEYAFSHRKDAVAYCVQFARGIPNTLADRFVSMYVNEDSVELTRDVQAAIDILRVQRRALHDSFARGVPNAEIC